MQGDMGTLWPFAVTILIPNRPGAGNSVPSWEHRKSVEFPISESRGASFLVSPPGIQNQNKLCKFKKFKF